MRNTSLAFPRVSSFIHRRDAYGHEYRKVANKNVLLVSPMVLLMICLCAVYDFSYCMCR